MESGISKWIVSIVWVATFIVLINTTVFQIQSGDYSGAIILILFAVLSLILYLAEGIEIAVVDLIAKDADQFSDLRMRATLEEIQGKSHFFFSQRQIFVVSIISFISVLMATCFSNLYVGYVLIDNPAIVGVFQLIFINLWILCFCQVAPKRLALVNSEKFFLKSKLLWPAIKFIGLLDIPAPSEIILNASKRLFGFDKRNLLPSRSAYYNASALLNGYCIDQMAVSIKLKEDGSADISRDHLLVFLNGRRRTIGGATRVGVGTELKRFISEVSIIKAWTLPSVEDLKEYAELFNTVFRERNNEEEMNRVLENAGAKEVNFAEESKITLKKADAPGAIIDPADRRDWEIKSLRDLPEEFNNMETPTEKIVCVMYGVKGTTEAGAFYNVDGMDNWFEEIGTTCRKLHFALGVDTDKFNVSIRTCDVKIEHNNVRLTEESNRSTRMIKSGGAIEYPIMPSRYEINWEVLTRH